MRIPQSKSQKIKAAIHAAQAALVFIAACLSLSVLTKSGSSGSSVAYFFTLCILTVPALIYQVVVPLWSRMWRLANVYAHAGCDLLMALLWLAAALAVASWNANGLQRGKIGGVERDGTCQSFLYGSSSKCEVSKACVGFGTVMFLLFVSTSTISSLSVLEHRRSKPAPHVAKDDLARKQMAAKYFPDDASWVTDTEKGNAGSGTPSLDEKRSIEQLTRDFDKGVGRQHSRTDSTSTSEGQHPGRPAYQGDSSLSIDPSIYHERMAPSALSPTDPQQSYSSMNARVFT